jgi:ATP-dependent Clp protease ATP-binding subunit ClpC
MDPRVRFADPDPSMPAGVPRSRRRSSRASRPGRAAEGRPALELRLARRSSGLERRLCEVVVGQEAAVAAVARAVERATAGLSSPHRPLASFLFLGRTGTGKTALAKALARELLGGGERSIVRVDCGEYSLPHEHARLIGSPPGYVGHESGGHVTQALLEEPCRIVLFDEVEKAHPRLHDVLLSILDEGTLTDGVGRRVPFDRSIVVMTSIAGASEMGAAARRVGFGRELALGPDRLRSIALEALARRFSPELLGRVDETIVFRELDLEDAQRIARRQLSEVALRARRAGARVAFPPQVAAWVARRGFSFEHGARGIAGAVRRLVESPLATLLLERPGPRSGIARARLDEDRLVFEIEG